MRLFFIIVLSIYSLSATCINIDNNDSILNILGISQSEFVLKKVDNKYIITNKIDSFKYNFILENKVIPYDLVLNNVVFLKRVIFDNTKFLENVKFNNVKCIEPFINKHCVSKKLFILENSIFKDEIHFIDDSLYNFGVFDCQIKNTLLIDNTNFNGETFLYNNTFQNIWFSNVISKKNFEIKVGHFNSHVFIDTSKFLSSFLISECKFKEGTQFHRTNLLKLLLYKSDFYNTFEFSNTYLPDTLIIEGSYFEKELDFSYAIKTDNNSNCKFYINNTNLSNIIFSDNFKIYFPNYLSVNQKNKIYTNILKKLEESNEKVQYRNLYIDYKEFTFNEMPIGWIGKVEIFISKVWWNFGFSKYKVLCISFIFLLITSLLIQSKLKALLNVYEIERLQAKLKVVSEKPWIKKIWIRFFLTFLFLAFIFFNLRIDFDKLSFMRLRSSVFIISVYAFGKVCTAYIINWIIYM